MGARLLSVSQDSGADPLGWQSRVALLSLWGHAGMKRCETLGIKSVIQSQCPMMN